MEARKTVLKVFFVVIIVTVFCSCTHYYVPKEYALKSDMIQEFTHSQKVTVELNLLLENIKLFTSAEKLEDIAPQISNVIKTLGEKEEELIDRAFILSSVLILLALAGSLLVALAYRFLAERFIKKKHSNMQN